MATQSRTAVDRKLLEILVCPLTKGPLRYDEARQELVSEKAGLAYPVRDGIPIMLVDEARELNPDGTPSAPSS
ncbi:MAG: Trm112 family protein [Alphaproteobacteria bacterium]|nr:Trm112 family protein [Alphaproteobacteria bacterium]